MAGRARGLPRRRKGKVRCLKSEDQFKLSSHVAEGSHGSTLHKRDCYVSVGHELVGTGYLFYDRVAHMNYCCPFSLATDKE